MKSASDTSASHIVSRSSADHETRPQSLSSSDCRSSSPSSSRSHSRSRSFPRSRSPIQHPQTEASLAIGTSDPCKDTLSPKPKSKISVDFLLTTDEPPQSDKTSPQLQTLDPSISFPPSRSCTGEKTSSFPIRSPFDHTQAPPRPVYNVQISPGFSGGMSGIVGPMMNPSLPVAGSSYPHILSETPRDPSLFAHTVTSTAMQSATAVCQLHSFPILPSNTMQAHRGDNPMLKVYASDTYHHSPLSSEDAHDSDRSSSQHLRATKHVQPVYSMDAAASSPGPRSLSTVRDGDNFFRFPAQSSFTYYNFQPSPNETSSGVLPHQPPAKQNIPERRQKRPRK